MLYKYGRLHIQISLSLVFGVVVSEVGDYSLIESFGLSVDLQMV